jgi:hypothetical protein
MQNFLAVLIVLMDTMYADTRLWWFFVSLHHAYTMKTFTDNTYLLEFWEISFYISLKEIVKQNINFYSKEIVTKLHANMTDYTSFPLYP